MKKVVKFISLVMSIIILILPCISVSASENPVVKRGLVMNAPYDEQASKEKNNIGMTHAFEYNGISTTSFVNDNSSQSTSYFLSQISNTLGYADSNDVSYVYINCHGNDNGDLFVNGQNYMPEGTYENRVLKLADLKSMLDTINGDIVLFIDACYSGNAIEENPLYTSASVDTTESTEAVDYSQLLINKFFGFDSENSINSGEFIDTKYTVFCSSLATEPTMNASDFSFAAYSWAMGGGYYIITDKVASQKYADVNSDGIVTAKELFDYSKQQIAIMTSDSQTACYYSGQYFESIYFSDYRLGDVNMDYLINGQDDLLLRKYIVGLVEFTEQQIALGDLDGDGDVDGQDSLLLQKYIIDLEVM